MPTFTDNVTRITAAWLNRIDTAISAAGTWVIDKASGSGIKVDTNDLHYQSSNIGTKNKAPGFYS